MDSQLLSIQHNDPLWIAIAFVFGLFVKLIGLPPLIGFLIAGFLLNVLGAQSSEFLNATADLGITLLLFSIGLKLKLKELARPEVWGVASLHMGAVTLIIAAFTLLLSLTSLPLVVDLDFKTALLIGFALSFSSTVFAVKILDELGANNANHGKIAIGVLVVQDVAAVLFIAVSMGKIPTIWSISLLSLIFLKPLFEKILDKTGHGELLILFGITMALGGADIFELVGIKGDVGALICGMLLANHPKSNELSKALLSFKDLFLVGFFLSVGMTALPGGFEILIALFFIVFLPIKVAMYYGFFNLFFLRTSTSWRASLNLANYSEFSLIVGAIAVTAGWLPIEWLAVFAVILSLSFILSAPLVNIRDVIYQSWQPKLKIFERQKRLSGEEDLHLSHIKIAIFGMGRIGTAAYNAIEKDFETHLVGIEIDSERIDNHKLFNRNVVLGDATNPDFWIRASSLMDNVNWILLTLSTHKSNMDAALRLKEMGYQGKIAAISKYKDEEEALNAIGVHYTFNIYTEAGLGFVNELKKIVG